MEHRAESIDAAQRRYRTFVDAELEKGIDPELMKEYQALKTQLDEAKRDLEYARQEMQYAGIPDHGGRLSAEERRAMAEAQMQARANCDRLQEVYEQLTTKFTPLEKHVNWRKAQLYQQKYEEMERRMSALQTAPVTRLESARKRSSRSAPAPVASCSNY